MISDLGFSSALLTHYLGRSRLTPASTLSFGAPFFSSPLRRSPSTLSTQPSDMSLEEIEERLSNVVKTETITQLKSSVWKERLEAIGMLKEDVEKLSDVDQYAELLVRLLCAVPGWSEKNVQVQQQVIEIIAHIASTVKRLLKRCVVLCLPGNGQSRRPDVATT